MNCSHYLELADLMLKTDFDWEKLTNLHVSGGTPWPWLHRDLPMCPVDVAICFLCSPLAGLSCAGTDQDPDASSYFGEGGSSHRHFPSMLEAFRKWWGWLEGQKLQPPSPRATAGEGMDWGLRCMLRNVCPRSEVRAALWQQCALTDVSLFSFSLF